MMITDPVGLYIHIPFCIRKCNYCDFSSYSAVDTDLRNRYINRLVCEIKSYKSTPKIAVDTVFFGGGTPSLLSPDEFYFIMDAVKDSFFVLDVAEISMEINPGTVSREKLDEYFVGGVNRISIGCQSLDDYELKTLGRIHNSRDFYDAYARVRESGFVNVNVDVMYGIPGQTEKSFSETLTSLIELSPEHISAYGLILEEGTRFWEQKENLNFPTEDSECEMYYYATEVLTDAGYLHYEISNYAKMGFCCRHNLKYWRAEEYIGVGLAAHSFFKKYRYYNPSSFNEYFSLSVQKYLSEEYVDKETEEYEYVMMRLRLSEGVTLSEYRDRFGHDFLEGREQMISEYQKLGFVTCSDNRFALTEKGFYISNTILSQLL